MTTTSDHQEWYHPRGSLATGPWVLQLDQGRAGWDWCSLRVAELAAGGSVELATGAEEMLVVPLAGGAAVSPSDAEGFELIGRASVFDGVTDFAYLAPGTTAVLSSREGGRFAVTGAIVRGHRSLPSRYGPSSVVTVDARGAGSCSRQVNNICFPATFDAERLLVCEVITPGGNWSSYPPHKHDQEREGEAVLEEIYYFEVANGPEGAGLAYQRVYGHGDRPVDLLTQVGTGDVVAIPYGWHGPSMAAPGYDLYYLNVMAGPGRREWLACDDPAHGWVRQTWEGQATDPRLPMFRSGRPAR